MFISYRWLQRHVDLAGLSAEEVATDLTLRTAEVEGVERFAPHLSDVVVGHVVERAQHPNADKLSLCRVDVGAGELLSIVCGAPNVAAGQKVSVATVGTVLPGDFKIKKSKIRGETSVGMICSERELGLGEEHDGIWVLPDDVAVGSPVADALDLVDWVIEVDNKAVTHRPDLWGHRGFARELAAIRGLELLPLDLELPPTGGGPPFPVEIESEGCSRYLALPIDGVGPQRSPDWLRQLLSAVGQRPIELLVDVSNFVMLDLGQPNHLFDRERLPAAGIVVRDARPGERMTTLDGVERVLEPADMLICAGEDPVALAGVMGGEGSKVGAETRSLLLEVASFHPTLVRRTAARLGLRTDASARFEKHLDPTLPRKAAAHLVHVLRSIQPELELPAPPTDAGSWEDPAREVRLRPGRARAVLGVEASDAEMTAILEPLGFGVRAEGDALVVAVPSARATKDVTLEEDLIEEVGRMLRFDRIEERPLVAATRPVPRDERRALVRDLKLRLAGGARFHEALGYSFLPADLAEATGVADEAYVEVVNPIVEGWQRVRRSVVPTLLGKLAGNLRHRERVALFEIGKGYLPEHADERGQPREVHEAGLVLAAPPPGKRARFDADALSGLKGVLADLVEHLGLGAAAWREAAEGERAAWAHPRRSSVAELSDASGNAHAVALLAPLDPHVTRALGLTGELGADVAAARVSLDALLEVGRRVTRFRPLPRFPGVKLDVALAVPAALPAGEVEAAIRRAGKGSVEGVELFDLYRGDQVGEGRKSLAYHVLLQAPNRTLSDADGQKFLDRLEREVAKLDGELRRE